MRTFRYHKRFPEGKIFCTEGREAPMVPSESEGWYDSPAKLKLTTDEIVEAAVQAELAKQSSDRAKLEAEVAKKTKGKRFHFATKDSNLVKILDNK